ncbi:hypothetical protein OH799_02215 [Nocardia sp. NBC_00881]|uniref:hypothetical protein n=1 Tax=Nocardia sp. NBC_00881 TaxID=2975995 RepID=UPI003869EAD2|nr:hypothetical protein OH799_02215 [Nocardia sp. NBC_00881]
MGEQGTPWTNPSEGRSSEQFRDARQTRDPAPSLTAAEKSPSSFGSSAPRPNTPEIEMPSPPAPTTHPRIGMLVGISVALILLVLAGTRLYMNESTVSASTSRPARPASTAPPAPAVVHGMTTIGRVTANDGKTLKIEGIRGATTTVHTTAKTNVLVFFGTRVSEVALGARIFVLGGRQADGSIIASFIAGG